MSEKILAPKTAPSQLPSGAWVLRVVIDGTRTRIPVAPAGASEARALAAHARLVARWPEVVEAFRQGRAEAAKEAQRAEGPTFGDVAKQWTSGELARLYPDHVKAKRTAADDAQRLRRYAAIVSEVPIASFTLDHAEAVMRALPEGLAPATRRQVAQAVTKVLHLAVYPLCLRAANPIPRGWLPAVRRNLQRQQETPFPSEIDRFVSCPNVPHVVRLFVGFIAREGMRHEEAAGLTWTDVDLTHGLVHLSQNKTDDARSWELRQDTRAALDSWHRRLGAPKDGPIFVTDDGAALELRADTYRAHLLLAGVDRHELHHGGKASKPTAIHALRALFVTESLAQGRSETWVTDRTGHRSRSMVDTYRRKGRAWARLPAHGDLAGLLNGGHDAGHDDQGAAHAAPENTKDVEGWPRRVSNPDSVRKRILKPSTELHHERRSHELPEFEPIRLDRNGSDRDPSPLNMATTMATTEAAELRALAWGAALLGALDLELVDD